LGGVASQPVRPMGNTQSSIQVLVNHDRAAGQRASPVHPLDLQSQILKADGVGAVDGALKLKREDQGRTYNRKLACSEIDIVKRKNAIPHNAFVQWIPSYAPSHQQT